MKKPATEPAVSHAYEILGSLAVSGFHNQDIKGLERLRFCLGWKLGMTEQIESNVMVGLRAKLAYSLPIEKSLKPRRPMAFITSSSEWLRSFRSYPSSQLGWLQ
jgi:hypothetical protein